MDETKRSNINPYFEQFPLILEILRFEMEFYYVNLECSLTWRKYQSAS